MAGQRSKTAKNTRFASFPKCAGQKETVKTVNPRRKEPSRKGGGGPPQSPDAFGRRGNRSEANGRRSVAVPGHSNVQMAMRFLQFAIALLCNVAAPGNGRTPVAPGQAAARLVF